MVLAWICGEIYLYNGTTAGDIRSEADSDWNADDLLIQKKSLFIIQPVLGRCY